MVKHFKRGAISLRDAFEKKPSVELIVVGAYPARPHRVFIAAKIEEAYSQPRTAPLSSRSKSYRRIEAAIVKVLSKEEVAA